MTKPVGKEVLSQCGITGKKWKKLPNGLRKHRRWQKAQERKLFLKREQECKRRADELAKLPNYEDFPKSVRRDYHGDCCPHCFTSRRFASAQVKIQTKQGTKTLHKCERCGKLYR